MQYGIRHYHGVQLDRKGGDLNETLRDIMLSCCDNKTQVDKSTWSIAQIHISVVSPYNDN